MGEWKHDKLKGSHILWLSLWWSANIAAGPMVYNLHHQWIAPVILYTSVHGLVTLCILMAFAGDENTNSNWGYLSLIIIFVYLGNFLSSRINKWADKHIGD